MRGRGDRGRRPPLFIGEDRLHGGEVAPHDGEIVVGVLEFAGGEDFAGEGEFVLEPGGDLGSGDGFPEDITRGEGGKDFLDPGKGFIVGHLAGIEIEVVDLPSVAPTDVVVGGVGGENRHSRVEGTEAPVELVEIGGESGKT